MAKKRASLRSNVEPIDRSPATETASSTSEEILAVASDSSRATRHQPTYDEIAEAAYRRYLERGASDGRDFDDWVEAERALSDDRDR